MKKKFTKRTIELVILFASFHQILLQTLHMEAQSTSRAESSITDNETMTNDSKSETTTKWSLTTLSSQDLIRTIRSEESWFSEEYRPSFYSLWNKSTMPIKTFQESYCPYRCHDDQRVELYSLQFVMFSCFPCQCKRPECEIYGVCCPDISEPCFHLPSLKCSEKIRNDEIPFSENNESNESFENHPKNVTEYTTENSVMKGTPTEALGLFPNIPETHNPTLSSSGNSNSSDSRGTHFINKNPTYKASSAINPASNVQCDRYLSIRSCPKNSNVSKDVIVRCETNVPENETTIEDIARATDINTSLVYYNKYCAYCNGVVEPALGDVQIECINYLRVYSATTNDELLRESLKVGSDCGVVCKPPDGSEPLRCDKSWYRDTVIDTCNVTGLWGAYDEDIVRGCANLSDVVYRFRDYQCGSGNLYKNIFCAFCNEKRCSMYSMLDVLRKIAQNVPSVPLSSDFPFSMLLGIRSKSQGRETNHAVGKCRNNEWSTPDGFCLAISCSPGKVLTDGNCSTALSEITGLGYHVRMWFVPQSDNYTATSFKIDNPPSEIVLQNFYRKFMADLDVLVKGFNLSIGAVVNMSKVKDLQEVVTVSLAPRPVHNFQIYQDDLVDTSTETTTTITTTETLAEYDFQTLFLFWVSGYILAKSTISRDEFEQTMIDKLLHGNIEIDFAEGIAANFTPVMMWSQSDAADFCIEIEEEDPDIKCYKDSVTRMYSTDQYTDVLNNFLDLTKALTCSFISFQPPSYVVESKMKDFRPSTVIILDLNVTKIKFSREFDFHKMSVDKNGVLSVCRELLVEKLALEYYSVVVTDVIDVVQTVLNLVCIGISMLGLLLTIITYASFPVLRSVAGKNNMCLCASMFLSQGSLLASYYTSGYSSLCTVLGISTHFLWLCMFCWSSICCFHMYKVFTSKTRTSHVTLRSQNILLIKKFVFSLLAPAIVVISVVVIMYIQSDGNDIGYGGSFCYLNSVILIGLAMFGPLVLTTLCNLIFFLVTVVSIEKVLKLQQHDTFKKDDRHNLYVYAKLSTVTGAFWLVFIIAEATDFVGLRMAAIILNGLQGAFIFVSYTCSRRVLHLYKRRLGFKKEFVSNTSTEKSSLGRHSSDINLREATSRTSVSKENDYDKDKKIPGANKQMLNHVKSVKQSNDTSRDRSSLGNNCHSFVVKQNDGSVDESAFVNPSYQADVTGDVDEGCSKK